LFHVSDIFASSTYFFRIPLDFILILRENPDDEHLFTESLGARVTVLPDCVINWSLLI